MFVQTGYIYHIKDDFFKTINDKGLMINHENGRSRPTYLTIVENDILWFIPLSSKVSKYKTIIKQKIQKYGKCNTILIRTIAGRKVVILLQNAFPTLEKYIDHPHIRNGVPMKVSTNLISEILSSFTWMMIMKKKGLNLFFTDIDGIKEKMLKEVEKDKQLVSN